MADDVKIEWFKFIVTQMIALKNFVFSVGVMSFCVGCGVVTAFSPLEWWKKIGLPNMGKYFKEYHEVILIITIIVIVILVVRLIRIPFSQWKLMRALNPSEKQVLCNAYYNEGKYSLPSNAVELKSLAKYGLIIVSEESDQWGGQEFSLFKGTKRYLEKHPDYFEKCGVKPEPPVWEKYRNSCWPC